ncbi:MAG: hypothetical protein WCG15_01255, partial [Actinomycetes bacterium]
MDTELATRMALRDSRVQLQQEMRRALSCTRKLQKIKLAKEWEEKYNPVHYRELIRCAKNKEVAAVIANWKIDEL